MPKTKKLKKQITYVEVSDDEVSDEVLSSEDESDSTDSDDDVSGNGNLVVSNHSNNQIISLSTLDLSSMSISPGITSGALTCFADGRVAGAFTTNPDAVKCETCDETFQNKEKNEEHRDYFTRSCTFCDGEWTVCGMTLSKWAQVPYCRYAWVKHKVCFETGDEAQEHAKEAMHTRCYYPMCSDVMAREKWEDREIEEHVDEDHCQGQD